LTASVSGLSIRCLPFAGKSFCGAKTFAGEAVLTTAATKLGLRVKTLQASLAELENYAGRGFLQPRPKRLKRDRAGCKPAPAKVLQHPSQCPKCKVRPKLFFGSTHKFYGTKAAFPSVGHRLSLDLLSAIVHT